MYLVSACLVGVNCKYSGGNNETLWIKEWLKDKNCMLVCPEQKGNLPTPRPPAEWKDGKVIDKEGNDVTKSFMLGSKLTFEEALNKAKESGEHIELAILKANSPSCGSGTIYDGTFTGTQITGDGIFASMLKREGIPVVSELQETEVCR